MYRPALMWDVPGRRTILRVPSPRRISTFFSDQVRLSTRTDRQVPNVQRTTGLSVHGQGARPRDTRRIIRHDSHTLSLRMAVHRHQTCCAYVRALTAPPRAVCTPSQPAHGMLSRPGKHEQRSTYKQRPGWLLGTSSVQNQMSRPLPPNSLSSRTWHMPAIS